MPELMMPEVGKGKKVKKKRTRQDLVGEFANFIEAGGSGRNNSEIAQEAVEREWETFTPQERLGFMTLRQTDIQRLCEEHAEVLQKGVLFHSEDSELRLKWDGSAVAIELDEEGIEVNDLEQIAQLVDMKSLVDFYRSAQARIEYESQSPPTFEERIIN